MNSSEWDAVQIAYEFPSTTNEGYSSTQLFQKSNGDKARLVLKGDEAFNHALSDYMRKANQQGDCNRIDFFANSKNFDDAIINARFDPTVDDRFQKNLPPSLRGKTVAWYKRTPVEEITEPDPSGVWSALGTVEEEFEIPYLHPFHANYPVWPGGDRHIKPLLTAWNTRIVFTQGLSSPAPPGVEVYLETNEGINEFTGSWQTNLVYGMGEILPKVTDLVDRLKKFKYLSVQIELSGAPADWSLRTNNGNVYLFLGLPNKHFGQFRPKFLPLNMKLLRPSEIRFILEKGAQGRMILADLFAQQGNAAVSDLSRSAVV